MGSGRIHVFVMSTNDKLQLELDLLDQNETYRVCGRVRDANLVLTSCGKSLVERRPSYDTVG